jgi:hypothetical protein
MSVKRIFLIVTINDVGFIKTDPGIIPQGEKIHFDQYIFPSLLEGEVIEFISRSKTGWLYVKRCKDDFDKCTNAQYGYVDWRYVAVYCTLFDLEEITVFGKAKVKLKSFEIDIIVDVIEKSIYNEFRLKNFLEIIIDFLPSTPPLTPPVKEITVIEIEDILIILTIVANKCTPEDFAEIMLRLWDKNKFYKIVGEISYDLSKKYPEAFFRICCLLYFTDLNQLVRDFVPDIIWEERKKIFRWPTLSDPNPIDKKSLRKAFKDIADISPDKLELRTFIYLSIKQHQIDYLLRKGGINSLVTMIADLDNFLDAGIQLLFKEEITNSLLEIVWGYNVKDIWDIVKKEKIVATLKLLKDNNGVPIMEELFVDDFYENKIIKSPYFKPEMIPASSIHVSTSLSNEILPTPKNPCEIPDNQNIKNETDSRENIKSAITAAASYIHDFIFSRTPYLLQKYPHLVSDINNVITAYKPSYYKKLSISALYRKQIEKITAKEFSGKYAKIANQLTWSDLVYIWFYNLGNASLGTKGNELEFGQNAVTTIEIMNHPTLRNLYQFTLDRVFQANNRSGFSVFVNYNTGVFFQSVKANDIVLNFLGSFTIEIFPSQSENKATFKVINELSLDSFTRFAKTSDKTISSTGRTGILPNVERNESSEKFIKIGGTLRCQWTWEKSL